MDDIDAARGLSHDAPEAVDRSRGARFEEALGELLYARSARAALREGRAADARLRAIDLDALEEAAAAVRHMVRDRVHRGTGGLAAWYPRTLAAWRDAHPHDGALEQLIDRFCDSPACAAWREGCGCEPGLSLEEAWHDFFEAAQIGEPAVREEELLSAIVRALAVTPDARFRWPRALRRAPGGCQSVSSAGVLYAAIDGRYLHGPVTPLIAVLLSHDDGRGEPAAREVVDALRAQRLVG